MAASWWIIVVSWNGRDDTLSCLDALRPLVDSDVAVVVVDNGSTDGTVEAVRTRHRGFDVLENKRNLGFSGGNNAGIRHALERGAEWVVLLNNDATLEPGAIMALQAAAAQRPRAGVLAGKLLIADPPDRIWFAGQSFWPAFGYGGRPRGYGRRDAPRYRIPGPTDRAAGALMAVSRTALQTVGLLDNELFAYVEDVDWCLRMRAAGFEVWFVPDAVARHRVSASTGGERGSTHALYYGVRNTIAVSERHRPLPWPLRSLRRGFVLSVFLAQALLLSEGRTSFVRAVLDGFADARAGRYGERSRRA